MYHRAGAGRHGTTQSAAARAQIRHLGAVLGGFEKAQCLDVLIRQRQVKPVAVFCQRGEVEFLRLVRRHPAFARLTHAIALFGLGKDHCRAPLMRLSSGKGGIKLAEVMAAAFQPVDFLIRHMGDQRAGGRIGVKELGPVVITILGAKVLILTVHRFREPLEQGVVGIAGKKPVPFRPP
ncbi:hypothetical protein TRIHO_42970 [Tritonibacter horizontis]|uniref:Uncharacterized protein n=1 Tax=Tritonibacter horizontis TaxID=1768241 RepID=A0A132BRV9_9RHOB|nr:hypothetical protein TRIHO_42970 [Tritonibacter horizontis]